MLLLPAMKLTRKRMIKIKNNTLAIDAAPAAMPKKPKAPATRATMRKMSVQRNITYSFMVNKECLCQSCATPLKWGVRDSGERGGLPLRRGLLPHPIPIGAYDPLG